MKLPNRNIVRQWLFLGLAALGLAGAMLTGQGPGANAPQTLAEDQLAQNTDLEQWLDDLGLNGGSDVPRQYSNRARSANTEDIAIEEAQNKGFDKGTVGGGGGGGQTQTTPVSGIVNCFASVGTATVTVNGNNVCLANNGLTSNQSFSFNSAAGTIFSIVLSCVAASCQMDLDALVGATCTALNPIPSSLTTTGTSSVSDSCTVN